MGTDWFRSVWLTKFLYITHLSQYEKSTSLSWLCHILGLYEMRTFLIWKEKILLMTEFCELIESNIIYKFILFLGMKLHLLGFQMYFYHDLLICVLVSVMLNHQPFSEFSRLSFTSVSCTFSSLKCPYFPCLPDEF
jgi:hypothetical protein